MNTPQGVMPAVVRSTHMHHLLGVGRTRAWQISKAPDFPRPIVLGGKAKGYIIEEVRAWLIAHAQRA